MGGGLDLEPGLQTNHGLYTADGRIVVSNDKDRIRVPPKPGLTTWFPLHGILQYDFAFRDARDLLITVGNYLGLRPPCAQCC